MTLSASRWTEVTPSQYRWEQEALQRGQANSATGPPDAAVVTQGRSLQCLVCGGPSLGQEFRGPVS